MGAKGDIMATVLERIKIWRDLMRADYTPEDPVIAAGRAAEQFLRTLVESNLKHKGAYCFLGKRVPSMRHRRRFEIDLVVLTKKHLHFLEVKNWSGDLMESGEDLWVQTRRSGEVVESPNLTKYNSEKRDVVVEYLHGKGIELDATYFTQKVIFMNPHLRIDRKIMQNPDVVPADKLDHYLATQRGASYAERFVHSVVEMCLDSEKSSLVLDGLFHAMPKQHFNAAIDALAQLETWDKVVLHGGRVLAGDLLKLIRRPGTVDLKALPSGTRCPVKWTRSKVIGLLQSLFCDIPLGVFKFPDGAIALEPKDNLRFHAAGDEKPSEILMRNVNMVVRG